MYNLKAARNLLFLKSILAIFLVKYQHSTHHKG